MKSNAIGIIGGAGPQAGVFLLERIFSLSNHLYGCHRDSDFPKVHFINFPFTEMLSPTIQADKLHRELSECLNLLRRNGATVLAIACNTLHAFLDENEDLKDLVHLPRTVASEVSDSDIPLVLCTSTSVQFGLHKKFFTCDYPDIKTQEKVDDIIDQILKGVNRQEVLNQLLQLLKHQEAKTVVLGCTELSLFTEALTSTDKRIIDPLEVAAKTILKRSFFK